MKLYTIEQQRSSSHLKCPVCREEGFFEKLINYSSNDVSIDFIKCDSCGVVFSDPYIPLDYKDPGSERGSLHFDFYVDIGAGIESLVRPLIPLIKESKFRSGNFIDIGCGFGYCVKFAESVMGLDSIGYEPGEYGKFGAEIMDVNIINQYFQSDLLNEKFSVVFSAEVIEHVTDPLNYLQSLVSILSQNGIGILTTPNTAYLSKCLEKKDEANIKLLQLLGPGEHLSLFDKDSIENLLLKSNISNFKVIENDENLTIYFSSRTDTDLGALSDKLNERKYYLNFLNLLLNSPRKRWQNIFKEIFFRKWKYDNANQKSKVRFRLGVAYRLMRELVNDGRFAEALKIQNKYETIYNSCFDTTWINAIKAVEPIDFQNCSSSTAIQELFAIRNVSLNLYGFLFYKINLTLNGGKLIQDEELLQLISITENVTNVIPALFDKLREINPQSVSWFGEYFRLYPRMCFGLVMLNAIADRRQEALCASHNLIKLIDRGDFEIDAALKPDCIAQMAVIYFREGNHSDLEACLFTLSKNYPEYLQANESIQSLMRESQIIFT